MAKLLNRTQFREAVFNRDRHTCVLCGSPGQDAHHIMERRLFTEPHEFGGYFLENGATVCGPCHLLCESTDISVETVRQAAGINQIIIPDHFYESQMYDKWGNIILPNGNRIRGELFNDESVQKIIAPHIHKFTHYVKFPRTYHLPWSPGMHDDDRMIKDMAFFEGKEVVVTAKMDGENTSCYTDYIHARSLENEYHASRTWIKNFWSTWAHDIPNGYRVCCENLFAEHSIHYDSLVSYCLGFHVWNDKNVCLSWDETLEWFQLLGVQPVQELYRGLYNETVIKSLGNMMDFDKNEGYVLRLADEFTYGDYKKSVGKFVRPNHIQTTKHHWKSQKVIPNSLKGN